MTRRSQLSGAIAVLGGAGFIGSNLAHSYLAEGREVIVIDNLSRPGVARNLDWLRRAAAGRLTFVRADIAEGNELADALGAATAVFHFAAQTAVTTSLDAPIPDFRTNALGTLNVLETIRRSGRRIPLIYSSTNKVYGGLDDLELVAGSDRYEPSARTVRDFGISEDQPLHFSTPYGCSKGVADQYVLDYASSYDLPTAVLRMSCIYGPRQFGTEDQGWVAHFLIRALQGQPISVYGDGRQVRDILFVDDAVAAYRRLLEEIETFRGTAFNLGGGPRNAVSLRQVLDEIATISASELQLEFGPWRTRDQLYFVADTRRIEQALDWRAEVDWKIGLRRLWQWLSGTQGQQPAREAGRVVA
jgi:CDP-paratose 2-epimerase